jgi:hypothetical protein
MVVAFLPIVHNSGSHDEVQNLGLTSPNHRQTLDKAEAVGQVPECPTILSERRAEHPQLVRKRGLASQGV